MRSLRPWCLAAAVLTARGVRADDPPRADPQPAGMDASDPDEPESPAAALDARIKVAIEKGVGFLRSQQRADGTWGDCGSHAKGYDGGSDAWQYPLGPTSMALYAMLKCDVPVSDPAVKRGFAWLRQAGMGPQYSAYEISAALLAVTAVADPFKKEKDRRAAGARVRLTGEWREWATTLQAALLAQRAPRGWRYQRDVAAPGGPEDGSSTQLAVLALAAADRCGVVTDTSVYADAAAYVLTLQEPTGPETERAVRPRKRPQTVKAPDPYAKPKPEEAPPKDRARGFHYSLHPTTHENERLVTGARTACGVGTLALARWALDGPDARPSKKGPRPVPSAMDQGIYDGLAWLSANWSPWSNPGYDYKNIYYLYCVERAMDLTGAERLGEHLWYLEMVQELLPQQHEKRGFWDTHDEQVGDRNPVVDTALALLFLRRAAKGGVPVPITTRGDDARPAENR